MYSITHFIFVFTVISLLFFLIHCFIYINIISVDLYKYKIKNFIFTFFIILSYILIFIILFSYFRYLHVGHNIDLRQIYYSLKIIWLFFKPLTFITKFYLLSCILISLMFVVILWLLLIKKIMLEIFKTYIYFLPMMENIRWWWRVKLFITSSNDHDIVSYILFKICYLITYHFLYKNDIPWSFYSYKLPRYHFYIFISKMIDNKFYKIFIQVSPILFIVYDCIYNNFIIITVYYYLIFYVPIMLLKRITYAMAQTNDGFIIILWNIYYNNKKNIFFIANKEQKEIITLFFKANLTYIDDFSFDMVEFYLQKSITYHLNDATQAIYVNSDGVYLQVKDNKIFEVLEDENGATIFKETNDFYFLL